MTDYRVVMVVRCTTSNAADNIIRNALSRQVQDLLEEGPAGQDSNVTINHVDVLAVTKRRNVRRAGH